MVCQFAGAAAMINLIWVPRAGRAIGVKRHEPLANIVWQFALSGVISIFTFPANIGPGEKLGKDRALRMIKSRALGIGC